MMPRKTLVPARSSSRMTPIISCAYYNGVIIRC
jgi:hypothetical protein